MATDAAPRLNLARTQALHFEEPDFGRYPALRLALEAGAKGGTWPTVLAAADEVAVEAFVRGAIGFTDIARVVDNTLSAHAGEADPSLEAVRAADAWARECAEGHIRGAAPVPARPR